MPKPTPPEDLKIDLAAPPAWTFAPGDTIIGTVVRQSHLVTPRASLELRLQAITQTKIEQYHGTNRPTAFGEGFDGPFDKSQFRAYWNLLPPWKAEVLFRGPVHIAKQGEAAGAGGEEGGSQSGGSSTSKDCWAVPFVVSIPLMPEESSIKRRAESESYLPLDDASIATQVLPGSFACKTPNDGSRKITTASITYQLEATLRYTHGGAASVSRASTSFVLRHTRHPCAEPPLPDYATVFHRLSPPVTVLSQRLAPGMHDAQLSFRQRTQKFFGSSRVPQLTYQIDFGMPRSVSLDFGDRGGGVGGILPFTMAVVPDPDQTNAALHGVQQFFLIHSITLSVDAITDVRTTAGPRDSFARTGRHVQRHQVVLLDSQKSKPIVLITGEGDSESSEKGEKSEKSEKSDTNSNTIDIGTMFNLHLRHDGLHKSDTSSKGTAPPRLRSTLPFFPVYPDFVSYLMKHTHVLSCEAGVSVAGESDVVKTFAPLRVLGEV